MNLEDKKYIYDLKEKGLSYSKISKETGISENTIKSFFRRENLKNAREKEEGINCKYCGKDLIQTKGHRQKKFCSDKCRTAWWKNPKSNLPKNSPYILKCKNCGKEFNRCGKKNRKYCSFGCYIVDRFKIKKFLKNEVCFLTDKQFNSELEYQIRINIMKKLLKEQIINDNEFKKIDTTLLNEYQPIFSSLKP